ncbi:MAG: tripartite tricarboxylate transporter permease, partial [Clostridiales bacterium]|nr:tripartite tricarboxylate transporter permease [Clostridiales bacterium]
MSLITMGFPAIANPISLVLIVLGVFTGIVFGAIPGLTSAMAITLFLPVTYSLPTIEGITLLIALYVGGISGGLISAILLQIPGTPSSLATCFDGHPMAQKGEAGRAISVGIAASFLGTLISWFGLVLISPALAKVAIKFSMPEYFAVALFSLSTVSTLVKGSPIKGLMACLFGILISTVGQAPVDGAPRFTFNNTQLLGGISTLPILLGFFAVAEVMAASEKVGREEKMIIGSLTGIPKLRDTFRDIFSKPVNLIRSSVIGLGIGILPGIGGGTSNIISYSVAQSSSRHPEEFGTGIPDGIVASEAANNASIGGALIPLLTLGIPGDNVTAILLGGLTLKGISAGPLLFTKERTLVGAVFCVLLIATIVMAILETVALPMFVKLLKIPKYILLPVVFVLCCVGAFGVNSHMFDVYCVLI